MGQQTDGFGTSLGMSMPPACAGVAAAGFAGRFFLCQEKGKTGGRNPFSLAPGRGIPRKSGGE